MDHRRSRTTGVVEGSTGKPVSRGAGHHLAPGTRSPLPSGANRIVMLFSSPLVESTAQGLRAMGRINYEREFDDLCRSLREANVDVELDFRFATSDTLRAVATLGCRVLHYSGHGRPTGLAFEFKGAAHPMSAEAMGNLFTPGRQRNKPSLVFVSACYSKRAGEAFVNAGVDHVVAVEADTVLHDAAAAVFTRNFYMALVSNHTVRQAFNIGRQAVKSAPDVAMAPKKFLLLPPADPLLGDESESEGIVPSNDPHDKLIFEHLMPCPRGTPWHPRRVLAVDDIPALPEPFFGRALLVYRLLQEVLHNRWVTVVGAAGMGTSSVVRALARYVSRRRTFDDGVHYVSLEACHTLDAVAAAISRRLLDLHRTHPMRSNPLLHASKADGLHPSTSFPSLATITAMSRSASLQPRPRLWTDATATDTGGVAPAVEPLAPEPRPPPQHRLPKVPSSPNLMHMGTSAPRVEDMPHLALTPARGADVGGASSMTATATATAPAGAATGTAPPTGGAVRDGVGAKVVGTDGLTLMLKHAQCVIVLDEVENVLATQAQTVRMHALVLWWW